MNFMKIYQLYIVKFVRGYHPQGLKSIGSMAAVLPGRTNRKVERKEGTSGWLKGPGNIISL